MNNNHIVIDGIIYHTGDKIQAHIGSYIITNAKIYVSTYEESLIWANDGSIVCFVCQNEVVGIPCPDKLGYNYSYAFTAEFSNKIKLEKINKKCFEGLLELSYPKR